MAMTTQKTPQYPFERLYVSPFTRKRGFDEQLLTYKLVPMDTARQPTGIALIDTVVDCLAAGRDPRFCARLLGISHKTLSASLVALTGENLVSLRKHWNMRRAYELLSYTDLPVQEVMKRCGYSSMPTFSKTVSEQWGHSPVRIRISARERGDIGKYAL